MRPAWHDHEWRSALPRDCAPRERAGRPLKTTLDPPCAAGLAYGRGHMTRPGPESRSPLSAREGVWRMVTWIIRLAAVAAGLFVVGRIIGARSCRGTSADVRRTCLRWSTQISAVCAQWEQVQRQECRDWQTRQEQRCDRWETVSSQRCDRWEQEQRRSCANWSPWFSWICIVWSWITTTVCRAWSWVTTTVCRLWTWVTVTFCNLWVTITTAVCRLWTWVVTSTCALWATIIDVFCPITCWLRRLGAPSEVSEPRSECIYGWTSRYQMIEERECVLRVVLRIRLNPDAGISQQDLQTARDTWEQGIEQRWSGRFPIERRSGDCACARYRVTVDLQWVTTGEHHVVRVRPGSGRADMANWFITSTGGTAAHEAGHMLGYADEYADAACPNRIVTSDGSIMQTSQRGQVLTRHYVRFASWASGHTCCDYQVAS